MRLFFALVPPLAQRREIELCVEQLRGGLRGRFLPAQNLHLTLVFLGELRPERVGELQDAARGLAGRPSFEVEWGGLDAFPDLGRARVAVLGTRRGEEELLALAQALRSALPEDLRPVEHRPFRPHLTVARFREPPPRAALEGLRDEIAPFSWRSRIGAVELVRSHLEPAGARYETLFQVTLAQA